MANIFEKNSLETIECVELSEQMLVELEGGSWLTEKIFYGVGVVAGAISKMCTTDKDMGIPVSA